MTERFDPAKFADRRPTAPEDRIVKGKRSLARSGRKDENGKVQLNFNEMMAEMFPDVRGSSK